MVMTTMLDRLRVSALTKLADHGEFVAVCYSDIANAGMKPSFREELETAIPSLITLLEVDDYGFIRSATFLLLIKLADHGEFVAVCYLDIS